MSWPNTVSLITGSVGDALGSSGQSADRIYVAVTPVFGEGVHRLLHAASGTVWDDRAVVTSGTPALFVQVPHVDQPGFVDGLGNEVTGWYYLVQVITRAGTGKSQWSYYWQPRVADGDTVDLDTLGDGVLVTDPVLVYTPGRDAADAREAAAQALASAQEAEESATDAGASAHAADLSAHAADLSAQNAATSVTDALAAQNGAEAAESNAEDQAAAAAVSAGQAATAVTSYVSGQKGAANGLAPLDGSQKLPESNVPDRLTAAALGAAYAGRKDIARSAPRFLSKLQAGRPAVVAIASDSASTSVNEWFELVLKKLGADYPNTFIHGTWWNKTSDAYDPEHTLQAGATPAGTTVLNDTFTRTASEVVGTTPDLGVDNWQQWTTNSLGNWAIDGADLVSLATVNRGEIRNAIGQGEHHVTVAGNINATATGTARFTDAYIKYVDHNNNIIARLNVDTGGRCQLYLYKQIAGVLTELTGHVNNPGGMGTNTASNEFTLTFGITNATVTATIGASTMTGTLTTADLAALEGAQYVGLVASGRAGDKLHSVSATINQAKPVLWFRNGSVGGSILQYQLDRLAAMYPEPADTMFISSSHNYGSTTDVPTYWAAIDAFIAGYRALYPNADTDFVICSQNPRIPPAWASINHADRCASLAAYANRRGYAYVPVIEGFSKLSNVATYIQADGVHPTEGATGTGSSVWRDIVYNALHAMLTESSGGSDVMVVDNGDGTTTITVDPTGDFTLVDHGDGTATLTLAGTSVTLGGGSSGAVTSVNTRTGAVVLTKTDVGLANVDNTADASKPVSTAQAAADALALAKAANLSDLANAGTARTNLGLGTAAVTNTGTGAGNTVLGNDSRLTDARTPTAHASTHAPGGTDDLATALSATAAPVALGPAAQAGSGTGFARQGHVHPTTGLLLPGNNLSDLASAATARTNLGLGTAATQPATAFDAAGAAAAAQAASQPYSTPSSGSYYWVWAGGTGTSSGYTLNRLDLWPVAIPAPMTVNGLRVNTSVAATAGGVAKAGFYGITADGFPDLTNLLRDCGSIATDATAGDLDYSFTAVTLPRFFYFGVLPQVALPTWRIAAALINFPPFVMPAIGTPALASGFYGYCRTGLSGALPTSGALTTFTANNPVRGLLKVA